MNHWPASPAYLTRRVRLTAASLDEHWGPERHLVVQRDHVGDRHPDAAVRGGGAERPDVDRAVDAGAGVDAHPAGLDRVVGARRDHAPREVPGPGAVGHV